MVESALEFIRIAEDVDFRDMVISMKSSNPRVMIQAYRQLVDALHQHGTYYPLHLGVTEAGDGEDGRIKGASGIGALLADGIGDTIRVSLTEEPEAEIPVARALAERYSGANGPYGPQPRGLSQPPIEPTAAVNSDIIRCGINVPIGGGQIPKVIATKAAVPPPAIRQLIF